jgi:peptide/nickel transport system permease protein
MATSSDALRSPDVFLPGRSAGFLGRISRGVLHFARRKPLGSFGAAIVLTIIVLAVFAPQVAPYGFDQRVIRDRLQEPSLHHLLGTDELGRDILSRIIYGARVSAFVGFGTVLIATLVAGTVGTVSGYLGGRVDTGIQRLVDVWIAFPGLILLLAFLAVFGSPFGTLRLGPLALEPAQQRAAQIILVLGLLFSIRDSRVVRGATLAIRNNVYLEAARGLGASHLRILVTYILPNVMPTLIVLATLQLGAAILTEASLGFLGFGIPDPIPSWGRMLSGVARSRIRTDPWLAFWPGLAISLAVFAFNMLGDALRDVLDPRLRGSR